MAEEKTNTGLAPIAAIDPPWTENYRKLRDAAMAGGVAYESLFEMTAPPLIAPTQAAAEPPTVGELIAAMDGNDVVQDLEKIVTAIRDGRVKLKQLTDAMHSIKAKPLPRTMITAPAVMRGAFSVPTDAFTAMLEAEIEKCAGEVKALERRAAAIYA